LLTNHIRFQAGLSAAKIGLSTGISAVENRPVSEEYEAKISQAEEVVDRVVERIGTVAQQLAQCVQQVAARAREEAEDIIAEAKHLRDHAGGEANHTEEVK